MKFVDDDDDDDDDGWNLSRENLRCVRVETALDAPTNEILTQ